MKLIIGLGNPGKEFEKTRHNFGFLFVDALAKKFKIDDWQMKEKYNAELAEGKIYKTKMLLVKPQTMMNNSGQAIGPITKFYKIKPQDIVLAHDDVDIPFGKFKISLGKNPAGHHGVESVVKSIKTIDINRLRLGTQPGKKKMDAMKLVLGKFTPSQQKELGKIFKEAIERLTQTY